MKTKKTQCQKKTMMKEKETNKKDSIWMGMKERKMTRNCTMRKQPMKYLSNYIWDMNFVDMHCEMKGNPSIPVFLYMYLFELLKAALILYKFNKNNTSKRKFEFNVASCRPGLCHRLHRIDGQLDQAN
eukprot:736784_1